MADTDPPTTPPLPEQSAADAADAARGAEAGPQRPAYDPSTDPDDTGVPPVGATVTEAGRGFFSALFDLSFRTFITRRLASVFYLVGLIAIGIGFIVYFVSGILGGATLMFYNPAGGISALIATIVIVPVLTFLAIILLRFIIEGVVALIAIAENTERTAEHTRR